MSSPYRKFNTAYSPKIQESEKDLIISQLKAQVFELEQNEKNFNSLSLKVRSLQSEVNLVSEEKLRLEYEIKPSYRLWPGSSSDRLNHRRRRPMRRR